MPDDAKGLPWVYRPLESQGLRMQCCTWRTSIKMQPHGAQTTQRLIKMKCKKFAR
jgi:hypothetical protein